LRKPAWFDYAHYPRASFQSTAARAGPNGQVEVSGMLTIKGHSQPVTVLVTIVAATVPAGGPSKAFDGGFELSRKAFGIGDPAWDGVLDDPVRVRFHLVAAAAATQAR
jgi:polyisoprenoid-binding protein YceI